MKDKIFREYDIRGKVPEDINEEVAYKIGLGYGSYLQEFLNQSACVVSHDNRLSSPKLHEKLIKGLLETGINVIDYGLTTTPMNYYARHINNLFGIMITASHNPSNENGFKFSFDHYANARGQMVKNLKAYIDKGEFLKGNGILEHKSIKEDYIKYVLETLNFGKRKVKVVLDPANGVPTTVARNIFEKLNIDLTIINEESDGSFPNHHPDPTIESNLEQLKSKVLEVGADIGIGFDGDGDRIGIIDEKGNMVSIEAYAILILRDIFDKVDNKKFLYDAKSSDNFKDEVLRLGGTPVICRTGTSYTQEKVLRENIPFGFQYVGHISLNDRLFSTESAMYSALRIIELLSKTSEPLSQMVATVPTYFNTPEEKFATSDNVKYGVVEKIKNYCKEKKYNFMEIDGLKVIFKDGWAYVRASNTGPNLTLRCEAHSQKDVQDLRDYFADLINIYNKF
ncbi:MAG: phosphomannomutase/phosphoglucomutase [Firmicutes bacterium]|nr:phosphomannomutase/phosphoglucomutase [Bacillota bacterium]